MTRILARTIRMTIVLALTVACAEAQTNTFPTSGNVGIGTTAPSTPLSIVYSADESGVTIQNQSTSAASTQISVAGTGREWNFGVGQASENYWGIANKFFVFDATAGAVRAVIDTAGNMGIGTTGPTSLLTLNAAVGAAGTAMEFDSNSTHEVVCPIFCTSFS